MHARQRKRIEDWQRNVESGLVRERRWEEMMLAFDEAERQAMRDREAKERNASKPDARKQNARTQTARSER